MPSRRAARGLFGPVSVSVDTVPEGVPPAGVAVLDLCGADLVVPLLDVGVDGAIVPVNLVGVSPSVGVCFPGVADGDGLGDEVGDGGL